MVLQMLQILAMKNSEKLSASIIEQVKEGSGDTMFFCSSELVIALTSFGDEADSIFAV